MSRLLPLLRRDRPRRSATAVGVLVAALCAVNAIEHLRLYDTFHSIAIVGPGFAVMGVAGLLLAVVLAAGRHRLFVAGAGVYNAAALAAILLSRTTTGLFGYRERGYEGADLTVVRVEIAALALLAVELILMRSGGMRLLRGGRGLSGQRHGR